MNFLKITIFTIIFFSFSTKNYAQDLAYADNMNRTTNYAPKSSVYSLKNSILENTKYSYQHQGKEVLVEFSESEHIEYHNNKKYFIKSSLHWVSRTEFTITIKETNLPSIPFGQGTSLDVKITKVIGDKVFYESTLRGRTWNGKMEAK